MKIEHCAYSPEFYKLLDLTPSILGSLYKLQKKYRFVENSEWFIHQSYAVPLVQLAITKGVDVEYETIAVDLKGVIDKMSSEWRKAFSSENVAAAIEDRAKAKWFGVLYLTPDAPAFIVKAVWRALAQKLHPDAGGDEEVFKELNNAYEEVLKYVR